MGLFSVVGDVLGGLFRPSGVVSRGLDILDQGVEDKDKLNRYAFEMYMAELQTRTIPIVDAAHKMGRQALAFGQMVFYGYCLKNGIPITWELVAGVSGVASAYSMAKGRGKP